MASAPINHFDLASVNFKNPFIMKLQLDYQHREMLQLRNPIYFRYAIRLLGDFIYKARLSSGRPISLFTTSLYIYLEMLLKSGQGEDLELFTIQLFQNGIGICTYLPNHINKLMVEVHTQFHLNDKLSRTSKLWLLLAMDIVKSKFELPPYDLQKYYVINLGQPIIEQFFRVHMETTIETFHKMDILYYVSEANNLGHEPSNSRQPKADRNKYLFEAIRTQSQAASNNCVNVSTTNNKPRDNIDPIALRPILGRGDSRKMVIEQNAKSDDLVVDLNERGRE